MEGDFKENWNLKTVIIPIVHHGCIMEGDFKENRNKLSSILVVSAEMFSRRL
jgi:hypothetical protein